MKKIIGLLIIIVALAVSLYSIVYYVKKPKTFKSQEECVRATDKKCTYGSCEFNCGIGGRWKGWVTKDIFVSEKPYKEQKETKVVDLCEDSDGGKDIYKKSMAIYKQSNGIIIHQVADTCATKNYNPTQAPFIDGISSCKGDDCYILEGYCGEYNNSPVDKGEYIQCANGCDEGVCLK